MHWDASIMDVLTARYSLLYLTFPFIARYVVYGIWGIYHLITTAWSNR